MPQAEIVAALLQIDAAHKEKVVPAQTALDAAKAEVQTLRDAAKALVDSYEGEPAA